MSDIYRKLLVNKPYVEIGGVKWATMNIGANTETDYGLYFQWGDTQGYTSGQCGSSGTTYAKPFYWNDCVLHNGTSNSGATAFTKYNGNDGKTVLDETDDAAVANWGGKWRMPTTEEFVALGDAVNTTWLSNYNRSGVAGLVCTDKTDSTKTLFFPAAGFCGDGSFSNGGSSGYYLSSSLSTSAIGSRYMYYLNSSNVNWDGNGAGRCYGLSIRPVLDE